MNTPSKRPRRAPMPPSASWATQRLKETERAHLEERAASPGASAMRGRGRACPHVAAHAADVSTRTCSRAEAAGRVRRGRGSEAQTQQGARGCAMSSAGR
eukprot:CAMPEP_0181187656 /NCGR_PEP_ID=MMETSP1096-20121128/10692_1 /TAXON_ID=156174 ORGANISM="Chrysochromulina ericina, Strain CCMP281" /NCGR_SAMPLE_ID=MMETSP1096 /ASSEMBLY_ACC=CAM_ASM_000453 /LENGTH=99 /DNA_ID=CAMNT_0023276651 /DNA_START=110 /DNA_END=410 /DNA_ORIENTATION=+